MRNELRRLRDATLPLYQELQQLGRIMSPLVRSDVPCLEIREKISVTTERIRGHYVEDWPSLSEAAGHFMKARALASEISRWTDGLNMGTDWFRDAVLVNLLGWYKDQVIEQLVPWGYPGFFSLHNHGHRLGAGDADRLHGWGNLDHIIPVPVVRPYNPSTQTRKDHRSDLAVDLDRYYAEQENLFTRVGFLQTVRKRARTANSCWLHFDWFIKYQMQGKTASEIAAPYRRNAVGEDAIYQAVKEVARLVQITLR